MVEWGIFLLLTGNFNAYSNCIKGGLVHDWDPEGYLKYMRYHLWGSVILGNCQACELLVRIPPATINKLFFLFLLSFSFFFISVL